MTMTIRATRRHLAGVALLSAMALLNGCGGRDVVAKAGRTRVHQAEFAQFQAGVAGPMAQDPQAALAAVGDRALLAEAARREGLEDQPEVAARLATSRREILAAAYTEHALREAMGDDVLRKRYDAQKETLTRRRIHVAHIVVRLGTGKEAAAASERIAAAYARIAKGEPFEDVARQVSEDPGTAARGGDLGPLLEGQVDGGFFDACARLEKGEVSKPFQSAFGFHVVKALEDPQRVTPTFDEAKGRLAADARREAEAAMLERLRQDIGVKLYPEHLPAKTGTSHEGKAEGK